MKLNLNTVCENYVIFGVLMHYGGLSQLEKSSFMLLSI